MTRNKKISSNDFTATFTKWDGEMFEGKGETPWEAFQALRAEMDDSYEDGIPEDPADCDWTGPEEHVLLLSESANRARGLRGLECRGRCTARRLHRYAGPGRRSSWCCDSANGARSLETTKRALSAASSFFLFPSS